MGRQCLSLIPIWISLHIEKHACLRDVMSGKFFVQSILLPVGKLGNPSLLLFDSQPGWANMV